MKRHFLWILYFPLIALLFTGCYVSDYPILKDGDKVKIEGTYIEEHKITGDKKTVTYKEQEKGIWPFKHYSYKDEEGNILLFKKLSSGLYLLQIKLLKKKNYKYEYLFADFIDDKTILILSADLLNKKDYIKALIKKYNIKSTKINKPGVTLLKLIGSSENNMKFLDAHDKSLMTIIGKLTKIK